MASSEIVGDIDDASMNGYNYKNVERNCIECSELHTMQQYVLFTILHTHNSTWLVLLFIKNQTFQAR